MTAPAPKSREEWYQALLRLHPMYSEDTHKEWSDVLDSIMALQSEVERHEKEEPIFDALMIELRGSWSQYQHYADLLNEARGFEKARQLK